MDAAHAAIGAAVDPIGRAHSDLPGAMRFVILRPAHRSK